MSTTALPPFAVFVNPGVSVRFLHALHELGLRPTLVVTRNPTTAAPKTGLVGQLKALAITGVQPVVRSTALSALVPGRVERISNTWAFATQRGWPVLDHGALKTPAFVQQVQRYGCKYAFVFGFSILPATLLNAFSGGVSGFHPTLLPYARGAVPSVWSALHGHPSAGFTLFRLDAGVDTGNILEQHEVPASHLDDARTHLEHVSTIGSRRMAQHALEVLVNDTMPQGVAQTERGAADRRPMPADCALSTDLPLLEVQRRISAGLWFGGATLQTNAARFTVIAIVPGVTPPIEPTPIADTPSFLVPLRTLDGGTITLVARRGTPD